MVRILFYKNIHHNDILPLIVIDKKFISFNLSKKKRSEMIFRVKLFLPSTIRVAQTVSKFFPDALKFCISVSPIKIITNLICSAIVNSLLFTVLKKDTFGPCQHKKTVHKNFFYKNRAFAFVYIRTLTPEPPTYQP